MKNRHCLPEMEIARLFTRANSTGFGL